jgi:hypothetical protein
VHVRDKFGTREFDISGVVNETEAYAALAAYGVDEGDEWPVPAGEPLGIPPKGIEMRRKGFAYRAVANYEPGVGDGDYEYNDQKWTCRVLWADEQIPMILDAEGRPLENVVGEPLTTQLTVTLSYMILEMWRYEAASENIVSKSATFSNKYNSNVQEFPVGTANPGEALIKTIEIPDEFKSGATKRRVLYRVLFKPKIAAKKRDDATDIEVHGFHIQVPNVGKSSWNDDEGDFLPLVKPTNRYSPMQPLAEPVLLRADGTPFDASLKVAKVESGNMVYVDPEELPGTWTPAFDYIESDGGVALLTDPTRGAADFSGLNIDANI